MPRRRKPQTRSSLLISIVVHSAVIGALFYWAARSGMLPDQVVRMLNLVPREKQEPKKDSPKEEPAEQAEQPSEDPPAQQPPPPVAAQPARLTASEVDPNAPHSNGSSPFRAEARKAGTIPRAPIAAGPTGDPAPAPRSQPASRLAPNTSAFSAEAKKPSTVASVLEERKSSAALSDAISSEQISRVGGSDVAEVVTKVTGVTTSDGKYTVVRGLSDRYNGTTLNGAELPTADPYRRSAQLDMIPTAMIDRVVITKTFTPDQPASFTGGGVNVVTKSFPDGFFFNLSLGGSYNTQTTGNDDFLTYEGGRLDWLALDDGSRNLPEGFTPGLDLPSAPSSARLNNDADAGRFAAAGELDAATKAFGAVPFGPSRGAPPPNHNFSMATGDSGTLFASPFGYFATVSYSRDFSFYADGISRRIGPGLGPGQFDILRDYSDARASENVTWASVLSLAYLPDPAHEFGFSFIYNQNSEDIARVQRGTTIDDPGVIIHRNRLHYTQRHLNTLQLKGRHDFEALHNTRLEWLGALSTTSQEEPDVRFFNYAEEGGAFLVGKASLPDPKNPTRYWRDLAEENRNLKLDITTPFYQWDGIEGAFKAGLFSSFSERTFTDLEVYYQGAAPFEGDPSTYLTVPTLGSAPTTSGNRVNFNWQRYVQTRSSDYTGDNRVQAAYGMIDLPLTPQLRVIGGARYEQTDLSILSRGYQANSVIGLRTNDTNLDRSDPLPALSALWSVNPKVNLRGSYAQTVARPSFRELAGYRSYDPVLDELLDGNPTLQMTGIDNYDLRLEWFPRPGEVVAISAFYKKLNNAIERRFVTISGDIITFENRESAEVMGVEFEARKSLAFLSPELSNFSLGANYALIESTVALTPAEILARTGALGITPEERPLYDQSPYILNVDFNYDNARLGTAATLLFSVFGPRVSIASLNSEDVYEQPAPILDFMLAQRIAKGLKVKVTAKNLLDPLFKRTYGEKQGEFYSAHRKGRTFGLSLSYEY